MIKKASLKDAFVKNMEAGNQQASNTAAQSVLEPQAPSILQPGSLYLQQAGYPPVQPKKKATFNLDAALHQRLKIAAAMHSREMVDIVQDALQAYLPALDRKVG